MTRARKKMPSALECLAVDLLAYAKIIDQERVALEHYLDMQKCSSVAAREVEALRACLDEEVRRAC